MRPNNLKTKIFLDSGDPAETREAINLLGFLDGQTTNPTLISENPEILSRIEKGEKFEKKEIVDYYKEIIKEISSIIPESSVSVEVYADDKTSKDEIISQARDMFLWAPNIHIKLPITAKCLEVAGILVKENFNLNMTLAFDQEQASAVYEATKGAEKGQIFISPFVGRLDDKGENGMDLVRNILKMYQNSDHHVEVLIASVRNLEHFLCALKAGSDIITAPLKVLKEWVEKEKIIPNTGWVCERKKLEPIPYREIDLGKNWREYNIHDELTDIGIKKFCDDWNKLIK